MRIFYFILTGMFFISNAVFAEGVAPFSTGPAPAQEYHAVGATTPTQAIVPQAVLASAAVAPSTPNTIGVDTSVKGQLAQLTQSTLTFEQQTDQRLQNLEDSNRAMGGVLQTMSQSITQLQQQLLQAQPAHAIATPSFIRPFAGLDSVEMNALLFSATALFLLCIGATLGRYWQRSPSIIVNRGAPIFSDENVESEYDFMGTAEAIPAKLDLARSYLAMSDYDQAKSILKTVIEKGNDAQRKEAGLLLQQILKK